MGDGRPSFHTAEGGRSRISKQIQHLHRPACRPDFLHGKLPIHSLFRKDARMLESHGFRRKVRPFQVIFHKEVPFVLLPFSASGIGTAVSGVCIPPTRVFFLPDQMIWGPAG